MSVVREELQGHQRQMWRSRGVARLDNDKGLAAETCSGIN